MHFSERWWPNTVFASALANAMQRAQGLQKSKHGFNKTIILFSMLPLSVLFFLIIEHNCFDGVSLL